MNLDLSSVDFGYATGRPVLQGVADSLPPGRVTAVIGPNGAGKSTLLRLLAGLLRPDRGTITLNDRPVGDLPARDRAARIAYVPQASHVGFAFSALAVARMGLYRAGRGATDGAALDALARVGLADRAPEPFGTLSAGQQQRVTLARALAQFEGSGAVPGPRVILADEPVSAMDPLHARRSLDLLGSIARAGAIVAVVLHDLAAAIRHADRALVLDSHGRVAAVGTVEQALTPDLLGRVFGVPFRDLSAEGRRVTMVPA